MSAAAVKKTKLIANRRILVEQVIRRLKTFRILKNELPISALHHIDDVIHVCAALTNLKEPIYKVQPTGSATKPTMPTESLNTLMKSYSNKHEAADSSLMNTTDDPNIAW